MSDLPRLVDLFGKRKWRARPVTKDGRPRPVIVYGESYPIAGEALALDARPLPSLDTVTFDGAVPSTTRKGTP